MGDRLPKLTVRIENDYIKKLGYIAGKNRRYRNQEICYALIEHIEQWEKKHGKIDVSKLPDVKED
ncbi:hypothetical protein [Anaeroselena agilis]|uniref:Arc-like DNA binding domain-containing protein n=1 Tax=Anaeroselena agilis TaxID=3063788 RepID=A0ABU3NWC2_9FIRM|nr:hypothetical protein [Selenomonadales bacterium 4137-cl]